MGFLSFFGSESKTTANTTSNATNTQITKNIQDTAGITISEASNITLEQTDFNAMGLASDLARDAIDLTGKVNKDSLDFMDALSGESYNLLGNTLNFADDLTARMDASNRYALEGVSDFARSIFGDSIDALASFAEQGQTQIGNTVTALNTIAREQSTSTDERVQDIAKKAMYVGGAVIAVMLIVMMGKK